MVTGQLGMRNVPIYNYRTIIDRFTEFKRVGARIFIFFSIQTVHFYYEFSIIKTLLFTIKFIVVYASVYV